MDALVSVVGSLAGSATEYTVDPVAHQLSYLFKHKDKFQNLKIKLEQLKDAGQRMQQSVHQASRNGEVILDDVQKWMTKVNEKISEQATTQLQEDEEKAMKRCFVGFCPDFKSRYQLSKKAEKEANDIAQLLNQKDTLIEQVSYRPPLECMRAVKEYEDFGSRKGAFGGVIAALEDDNVNLIGVYGMGGVGKTTLVKEAARQAKEKKLFGEVVLVSITQTPNKVNVQNEIAEKLGLTIEEKSMDVRAARLRDRLKKETKVLIILDDLWVTLDLEALGIPSGDEHKGCKILMTSRRLDVLESMNSRRNLSIETLKEDEAWNLFKNMAGHIVERSDMQPIAIEVAKRCAGLPIAIATIAKALKYKPNLFEWRDALRQLSKPSERNFKGIPADAYSAIELSYKFIKTEELGPIFLLCSIMSCDAAIEDLLRYVVGLGLFPDIKTVEETRDKVLALVSSLKASCLLLDGSDPTRFELHDVVRDVALSIASRDQHWLVFGSDNVFKEWPDEATMKNCKLISLQHAELSDELLNHELECPDLTFFSMGSKVSSLELPNNFFKGMQRLKVLNLSKMDLSSLPSSIGSLKTLSTLCLSGSELEDVATIGELKNLEILDLRESTIAVLPEEIGQLTRLKLLDLSDCEDLEVISPNVLSRLSRLEELYLYNSFDRWEVEGGIEINQRSNASLVELHHLSHLTTLEVNISDVQAIPKHNLFFGKLERCKISIGDGKWDRWFDKKMETSRMLKLKMNKSIYFVDGFNLLLRKVESLVLDGVEDVGKMLYDRSTEGLPHLKHLVVRNVSDIKVVNSMMLVSCLESLDLRNLMNLEAICEHGQLKDESFGRLRVIKVGRCKMLKNLLPFSLAQVLCRQLEEIEVSECENMTELLVEKKDIGGENNILEFTKLRSLRLKNLSRFKSLWYSEKTFQHATWLFDQKVIFPVLEILEIGGMKNLERLWPPNQLAEHSFSKLTTIHLVACPKLLNVFPSSMLTRLQKLCYLSIWNCESVEEIIYDLQEGDSSSSAMQSQLIQSDVLTTVEFPCLTSLSLWNLPNLKSMYRKMLAINWPSLEMIVVGECDKVVILFGCEESLVRGKSSSVDAGIPIQQPLFWVNQFTFPNLHKLSMRWNAGIKDCNDQLRSQYLSSLKVVLLDHFPEEVTKVPSYLFHLLSLPSLQTLEIINSSFKELMMSQSEEGGEEKPASAWVIHSQITELKLNNLRELMHLWKEKEGLRNLRILKVEYCSKLRINLVPSYVSFRNLVTLEVSGCDGIIKLITHSTAKSLVHLKQMSIYGCNGIEEIVGGDDNDDDEISFPKLNKLTLICLPKLESFSSSGNQTFGFPSLEEVSVIKCPKMKMFSQRDSNTPMLRKVVQIDHRGKEERWEGSLNRTVQQLFREKIITEPDISEEDQTDSSTS